MGKVRLLRVQLLSRTSFRCRENTVLGKNPLWCSFYLEITLDQCIFRGLKDDTSKGWSQCVEFGWSRTNCLFLLYAAMTRAHRYFISRPLWDFITLWFELGKVEPHNLKKTSPQKELCCVTSALSVSFYPPIDLTNSSVYNVDRG